MQRPSRLVKSAVEGRVSKDAGVEKRQCRKRQVDVRSQLGYSLLAHALRFRAVGGVCRRACGVPQFNKERPR
jgi:hypothetical protein